MPSAQRHHGHGSRTGGGTAQRAQPPRAHIDAPYNFVPLSRWVYSPPWADLVSHDVPLQEGLSGSVAFTFTARTPILVGGKHGRDEAVAFFRLLDSRVAIPGTSIRGMVRNVVEIASFGKMRLVDERRLGVRDLTAGARKFYGDLMSRNHGDRNGPFEPRTKAGWLRYDGAKEQWIITPCQFARIDHSDLRTLGGVSFNGRPSAREKYRLWGGTNGLKVTFDPGPAVDHAHSNGKKLRYRKAGRVGSGSAEGMLVFTGQPGPNKHMEFVFFDEKQAQNRIVPSDVWRGFLDIHEETDEWGYWKNRCPHGPVPVFFLEGNGQVSSLGLAMMYKLAYRRTIVETIRHTSPLHCSEASYDLAELIFGTVSEDADGALKGRVSFSHAVCEVEIGEASEIRAILNGPKPTYYPNYIRQDAESDSWRLKGDHYRTYMDGDAEIRGWKRYPARTRAEVPPLTPEQRQNVDVQVRLCPLPAGTRFTGTMSFHNLMPEELGALLWTLTWGGNAGLRHSIGMGKPFGFGQIEVAVQDASFAANRPGVAPPSLEALCGRFEECMDGAYRATQGGSKPPQAWRDSEQIVQLFSMADPIREKDFPGSLRHMRIEPRNEFVAAKSRENLWVLPEYTAFKGTRDADLFNVPPVPALPPGARGSASPASVWVEKALSEIVESGTSTLGDALRGRLLVEAWNAITDADLKAAVLKEIERRWRESGLGWGDKPLSGGAKKAFAAYGGQLG